MKNWFMVSMLMAVVFILAACEDLPIETNMSESVHDFSFTNQDNETISSDSLEGSWWIADFIFTNCTTVCLPMTSNMKLLQEKVNDKNIPIQLISFSVDPDYDSPEVLKTYGDSYDADFGNWSFLTGYDFKTIKKLSIKSFRAIAKEPDNGDDQVYHDTRFFLVDPEGNIVKSYDGVQAKSMDEIVEDLLILKEENKL